MMATKTPHIRRVVTGLDADGRSVVLHDGQPSNSIEPIAGLVFSDIWETADLRAYRGSLVDTADRPIRLEPLAGGSIFKAVTFPPMSSFAESEWADVYQLIGASAASNEGGALHKTRTIDYVIVISGEIHCVLDKGGALLRAGDVLVQQGTNHAWENRSDQPATIVGIMIDAAAIARGEA